MKLYTEEELRKHLYNHDESFFEKLTPIELPSDEEIEKAANSQSHYEGAMWLKYAILMRDKIQGVNYEQQ